MKKLIKQVSLVVCISVMYSFLTLSIFNGRLDEVLNQVNFGVIIAWSVSY